MSKADRLADAEKTLNEAAETPDAARRRDSYYNLGVTLGEAAQKKTTPPAQPPAQAPPGTDPNQGINDPNGGNPLQKKVEMLEQSLASMRKSILATNFKDTNDLDGERYNYETLLEMLRKARQELEQQKQQQQQQQKGDKNKDGKNQQGQQNQQGQKR